MTSTMMSSVRIPVPGSPHTAAAGDSSPDGSESDRQSCIVGTLLMPRETPVGLLTIHSATATPARFYTNFADYAVTRGLAVLTYDVRGVAASGPAREHTRLRMRDWMQQDANAVSAWAANEFPELPKVALGHSLGGHALLLGNAAEDLHGIVTVGTSRAALHDINPLAERLRVGLILRVLGPLISPLVGYAPGRRLGLGEDIPTAAMLEWGRWVRMSEYFFDDPTLGASTRMARLRTPVLAIGTSDDNWASPAQVDALLDHARLAEVERRTFSPQELEVSRIGHHGLLRRSVAKRAWPEIISWLLERLPQN
ncbi:alpha/beta hydrolase family protein [Brevibacterium sp. UCMA 11754]|uniref:alpha/beta hydrolase family protein n=1 Tax=Brevibacterium sp. UCMA 11754 TaxID=2749198 RepID=UPI001F29B998|nr:alpha/beta fold hydrolase [Brevibacterium sp. UCMA 11754]